MLADGDIPAMISPTLPRPFVPRATGASVACFRTTRTSSSLISRTPASSDHACHDDQARDRRQISPGWRPTWCEAFEKSKQLAYRRLANPRMVPLAFVRTARRNGGDARRGSVVLRADGHNRKNLQTMQRYCHQQGLIKTVVPLDPGCLKTPILAMPSAAAATNSECGKPTRHDIRTAPCRDPRRFGGVVLRLPDSLA